MENAAVLWNRYVVSSDGKTAYERMRGKKSRVLGIEFGEKIHWRRAILASHRSNKLDIVWADGVYLGHKALSGESIIGTSEGVFKTRTDRRVPAEDRWNYELFSSIIGVPWKCGPQADEAEQIIQDVAPLVPTDYPTVSLEPPQAVFREEAPRRIYLKTDMLNHPGYTPGCPGCRALQTGRARVGHNDECRN